MNFFTSIKSAEFAAKISAAAGFDFAAAMKAGDVDSLKNFVASAVAASKPDAALAAKVTDLEAALEAASETNAALSAVDDKLTAALAGVGFKVPVDITDGDALKASLEAHIKVRAQGLLAQTGHPAIKNAPEAGAAKVLGRQAFQALNALEQATFVRNGGRLTD